MGLFGGGNSSSTSNTTNNNLQGTLSPSSSLTGNAGSASVIVAPQLLSGGSGTFGAIDTTTYNAPLNITESQNEGDAAIAAAQQTAQASINAASANSSAASGSAALPSWLTNLFTGDNLYWIIGAIAVLMVWRGHIK